MLEWKFFRRHRLFAVIYRERKKIEHTVVNEFFYWCLDQQQQKNSMALSRVFRM